MVNMMKVTNFMRSPIVKTGVVIKPNDLSSFYNALKTATPASSSSENSAFSYTPSYSTAQSSVSSEPNTSLRWYTAPREQNKLVQAGRTDELLQLIRTEDDEWRERIAGTIKVPIGKGELSELISEIEKAMDSGGFYLSAIYKQVEKYTNPDTGLLTVASNDVDFINIDPYTGEVKHASPRLGIACLFYSYSGC